MLDSLLETQIQECLAGKDAKVGRCLFQMQALNRYYHFKPYLDYHQARFRERVLQEGLGHGYSGHRDALAEARQLSAKLATLDDFEQFAQEILSNSHRRERAHHGRL
jgi:hypothetical protein